MIGAGLLSAWALSGLALGGALWAPPTLADGLRAVGALRPVEHAAVVDAPMQTGSTILLGVSGAALLTGVIGYFASPNCATRDAGNRCIDAQGSAPIFPSLIVLGLGGLATGAWWHQRLPVDQR